MHENKVQIDIYHYVKNHYLGALRLWKILIFIFAILYFSVNVSCTLRTDLGETLVTAPQEAE